MWRTNYLIERQQWIVSRRWLFFKNVNCGSCDFAIANRRRQRGFVKQTAASAIDDSHTGLHLLYGSGVNDVARRFDERRMQSDEIGARKNLLKGSHLYTQFARRFGRKVWVVGDDIHAESAG